MRPAAPTCVRCALTHPGRHGGGGLLSTGRYGAGGLITGRHGGVLSYGGRGMSPGRGDAVTTTRKVAGDRPTGLQLATSRVMHHATERTCLCVWPTPVSISGLFLCVCVCVCPASVDVPCAVAPGWALLFVERDFREVSGGWVSAGVMLNFPRYLFFHFRFFSPTHQLTNNCRPPGFRV